MKCQGIFDEPHHVTVQIDNEFDNNETTKKKIQKEILYEWIIMDK